MVCEFFDSVFRNESTERPSYASLVKPPKYHRSLSTCPMLRHEIKTLPQKRRKLGMTFRPDGSLDTGTNFSGYGVYRDLRCEVELISVQSSHEGQSDELLSFVV